MPGNLHDHQAILEDAHDRTIRAVAWAPGEDRLATASFDGTCVVWMRRDGEYEQVATLQGHENEVKSVAFDPSGKLLATCRYFSLFFAVLARASLSRTMRA